MTANKDAVKKVYRTRRCRTSLGDDLEVFQNDYITRQILRWGIFSRDELAILSTLFSLMPDRRAALDIGANIGNHCAVFSRFFQETRALEPHREVFAVLSGNIERNGWRARAHNIGLADENGFLKLFISEDGNLGATSFAGGAQGREVEVEVITGDDFVKNMAGPVDFIKIDAESFEGQIIKGLASTIASFQPVISLEWNNQKTRDYFRRHALFSRELKGYHILAMYSRWDRRLWPGIIAKARRRLDRIFARPGDMFFLADFETDKDTDAVILVPPKHSRLIAPLRAAHPFLKNRPPAVS